MMNDLQTQHGLTIHIIFVPKLILCNVLDLEGGSVF